MPPITLTLHLRPTLTLAPAPQLLAARGLQPGGRTQRLIAAEAVRRMQPFIPRRTGALAASARPTPDGTRIRQTAPYARRLYESATLPHRPPQTHHWFLVMKHSGGAQTILNMARRSSGAR